MRDIVDLVLFAMSESGARGLNLNTGEALNLEHSREDKPWYDLKHD
jgi:hypothetical protein